MNHEIRKLCDRAGYGPGRLRALLLQVFLVCVLAASVAAAQNITAQRIRVDAATQAAKLTHSVDPIYPPHAKQAKIEGVVSFQVIIGTDGSVLNIQLITGHPLLVPSASEAVKQMVYRPTVLNLTYARFWNLTLPA
jgi:outer membrane biosynthesis protein TonB